SHYFQVLIYMLMLPITHPACRGRLLGGEIQYRDYSSLLMPGELTEHRQAQIRAMIERIGSKEPLIKVPSAKECGWCPVAARDCRGNQGPGEGNERMRRGRKKGSGVMSTRLRPAPPRIRFAVPHLPRAQIPTPPPSSPHPPSPPPAPPPPTSNTSATAPQT